MDNTRHYKSYRDIFSPRKEEEITIILTNINGLRTEGWKVKND